MTPFSREPYCLAAIEIVELKKQLDDLIDNGIIRSSNYTVGRRLGFLQIINLKYIFIMGIWVWDTAAG